MMFNKLTDAQAERLYMLAEECGEVMQAIGKILRHGYDSQHPAQINSSQSNQGDLERELADLFAIGLQMVRLGDIDGIRCQIMQDEVWAKKLKWTHHQ